MSDPTFLDAKSLSFLPNEFAVNSHIATSLGLPDLAPLSVLTKPQAELSLNYGFDVDTISREITGLSSQDTSGQIGQAIEGIDCLTGLPEDYVSAASISSLSTDAFSSSITSENYASAASNFTSGRWATEQGEFLNDQKWLVGDFNGDGKHDLAKVFNDTEQASIDVYFSNGSSFTIERWATQQGGFWNSQKWLVGDFNGDGRDDLAKVFNEDGQASIDVHLSSGSSFNMERWATQQGGFWNSQKWLAGDFNGDGGDDLAKVFDDVGQASIDVYLSSGSSFTIQRWVTQQGGFSDDQKWLAGDFNNDGDEDLANIFNEDNRASIDVHLSKRNSFIIGRWTTAQGGFSIEQKWLAGDFNADGQNDLANVFNESNQASIDVYAAGSPESYSSINGYGLVNAAAAVAKAIGQPAFSGVPDLGGQNWGADLIKAPEVWVKGYTGQGLVVAVLDTGVDRNHPDLSANIWTNSREIAGNGVDDDNNGYIDDYYGWNFIEGNNNTLDVYGHGSHVAGTIAAVNNDFGITGIAYNAKIMPVKVLNDSNKGNFAAIAQGVYYAVNNGAKIINMSLAGSTPDSGIEAAIQYAASKGAIVVIAAGNSGGSTPQYPAYYATNWGLAVGAVDSNKNIANFSNRAGSDSRMAYVTGPGVNIYSTLPNGRYGYYNGSSMAAPYVSGLAALMLSANPNLSADEVRQIITQTAVNV
ncbi:MAG: S8 family serine peptidase [Nostoc sp. DedSLP05]|nr:S8 family serine peptidase [Nostoc sp. DedSLP05]